MKGLAITSKGIEDIAALEIKELTNKPIIVLSYFDREDIASLKKVDKQISLPIYDLETAEAMLVSKRFL